MKEVPPSPPPPPPLPHYSQTTKSNPVQVSHSTSSFVQKATTYPPGYLLSGYSLDEDASTLSPDFSKTYYFFYGTLKDPKILSHVLDTTIYPTSLRPAYVTGYVCELWGEYQALVDGAMDAVVEGVAYEVQNEEDAQRLASYETNAYRTAPCAITFIYEEREKEPEKVLGKTFMYAGDPQALREKRWDRKLWMRNMGFEPWMKKR